MANPWFRFYAEFLHDPKVRVMSETDQLRLVLLFCLRCGNDKPLKDEHISFSLRISADEWRQTKATFIECGFLTSKNDLVNWDSRQFLSDSSADRVKKYRSNRKDLGLSSNGYTKHSATVMSRDGNCCVYCGSQNNLCIDHILPTQQGGNDDIGNLATACKACNSGKAGRTPEQARYSFLNKQTESIWLAWMSLRVTVTVTPPEQNRTEQNRTDIAIGKPNCPHQEIINLYHELLPASPRIKDWTPARSASLRARWNEDDERQRLGYWRGLFEYIAGIPFLTGKVASNGRKPFMLSLDWLLKAENFAKVREGRYEDQSNG